MEKSFQQAMQGSQNPFQFYVSVWNEIKDLGFVNGLKQLDTYKRPIHCTDMKRETLYINDNNEWECDNGKHKLKDAITVVSNMHYFTLAESLGGVESLCGHPASMTHAAIPKQEREKTGVVDSLIRLSVGIENIEDLSADLGQALEKI